MKQCSKCLSKKSISQFYAISKSCKECDKEYSRKHRIKNIIRIRKYDLNRRKNRDRLSDIKKNTQWKLNNPLKIKAARKVQYAIKIGKIKRLPCEKCGELKSQAHHDDYSKPLIVRFLCAAHHKKHHLSQIKRASFFKGSPNKMSSKMPY